MNYQKSPKEKLMFITPNEAGENVVFNMIQLIF